MDHELTPVQTLPRGFSHMTNDVLHCKWLKAINGLKSFSQVVQSSHPDDLYKDLFRVMADDTSYHPDPAMLPNDLNAHKSSVYVPVITVEGGFGTRTTTIVTVDHDNNMTLMERTKTELYQCPSEWYETVQTFQIDTCTDG